MMKRAAIILLLVVCWTITIGRHNARALPGLIRQAPAGAITATFMTDGFTLSITARCESPERPCPFRAEIHAPPSLFELIDHVEYTFSPDRPKSPSPITDASTSFRLEAKQMAGAKVHAEVTLRPRGGAPSRVVRLEGTIPFAGEVKPPLPSGLRFQVEYRPWYLEGGADVGDYFEYQLPAAYFTPPRVVARADTEYMFEEFKPKDASFEIVAVIRWKNGTRSTHAIPFPAR